MIKILSPKSKGKKQPFHVFVTDLINRFSIIQSNQPNIKIENCLNMRNKKHPFSVYGK